jgi:hypothetical protein
LRHRKRKNDEGERFVAVLEIPPVTSPETAVKVTVAAEVRKKYEHTRMPITNHRKGRNLCPAPNASKIYHTDIQTRLRRR